VRRQVVALVFMFILAVRFERSGTVHYRRKLSFQYLERSLICKARNWGKSPSILV
jgi:hypothetical protein